MIAVRGSLEPRLWPCFQAILAHQPRHPVSPYRQATFLQLGTHPWASVGLVRRGELGTDVSQQDHVLGLALARGPLLPRVETADADVQGGARSLNRNLSPLCIDQRKIHRLVSLAKKAVAFFSKSLSARRSSFSRRKRASSFSTSSCGPAINSARSSLRFQVPSDDTPTPRSSATALIVRPLVAKIRTASRRNASSITRPLSVLDLPIDAPLIRQNYQKSPPLFRGKSTSPYFPNIRVAATSSLTMPGSVIACPASGTMCSQRRGCSG